MAYFFGTQGVDDFIFGTSGTDIIADSIVNSALSMIESDYFYGGDGTDTLISRIGNDRLFGENGDDFAAVAPRLDGTVRFDGGDGFDRIQLTGEYEVFEYDAKTVLKNGDFRVIIWNVEQIDLV